MSLRNYEHLSKVYDIDWGNFALNYVDMIKKILIARKINKLKYLILHVELVI